MFVFTSALCSNKIMYIPGEIVHSEKGNVIYRCYKCGKVYYYRRKDSITRHRRECGQAGKFVCKYCDKRFKRNEHLSAHTWTVHKIRKNST